MKYKTTHKKRGPKPKVKPVNKGGAPEKYNFKYNEQARKLCLMGYIDKQLADFFEVNLSTLSVWKNKYPKFKESLKAGKEVADANVTACLYNRATGYDHVETKVFNNQGEILTHDVNKHYPPDPLSMKYWLNNRQPERWREKVEHENIVDTKPIKIEFTQAVRVDENTTN